MKSDAASRSAFVATVYGVACANLFFLPAAGKLKARVKESVRFRELMLEGVLSIVEGLNPKLIRTKLDAYLMQPASKPKGAVKKGQGEGGRSTRRRGRLILARKRKRPPSTRTTSGGWSPTPTSSLCCSPSSW